MFTLSEKKKVLVFIDHYLPGYKAGGPIRTLANVVERLGEEFQFRVVTRDRDLRENKSYSGVKIGVWQKLGKAEVFYLSPGSLSLVSLSRFIRETEHNMIYINSFFSPHFTMKQLVLRKLRMIPKTPVIVAPRGEFSPGALELKSLKKHVYIVLAKMLGLYSGVVWQASSRHEEADIRRWFGKDIQVVVAPNLPPVINVAEGPVAVKGKTKGCLKIIFLSRISRKKNLHGALKMLSGLKGRVQFNVYGPMEDEIYWAECQKIINSLPENIEVRYYGSVEHDRVGAVMREHDIFFSPTLGENFGHVILEALYAGCPVLISDQTPWRSLEEKGVGWDLPLDMPDLFQDVLQKCLDMNGFEYMKWSDRAREYGFQVMMDDKGVEQNRQLFHYAVGMISKCGQEKMNV